MNCFTVQYKVKQNAVNGYVQDDSHCQIFMTLAVSSAQTYGLARLVLRQKLLTIFRAQMGLFSNETGISGTNRRK